MKNRHRNQWEHLGKNAPYWAVLTEEQFKSDKLDRGEFFKTGELQIQFTFAQLEELDASPATGTALDFGCGVGRLSRALSTRFERVIASDLSASMLEEAKKANADFRNIEFVQNDPVQLNTVDENSLDFIFSLIVLQHMPRASQEIFITSFCRALKNGGIVVFQTPSRRRLNNLRGLLATIIPNFIKYTWRALLGSDNTKMEMHSFPREDVERILAKEGVELFYCMVDNAPGPSFVSYTYFGRKLEK